MKEKYAKEELKNKLACVFSYFRVYADQPLLTHRQIFFSLANAYASQ